MIDFTIHHKKEPLNKIVAVELPMNADNLSDLLQELGYEPPEKLKVNSKGKPYVIELNSDTNMGFAILERLCDNDTSAVFRSNRESCGKRRNNRRRTDRKSYEEALRKE